MKMLRYQTQYLFKEIGIEGQNKIFRSTVAVLGCGGLGTHVANHLVRAGIGKILIFDNDKVELTNLQRQDLFEESDVISQTSKVIAAKKRLNAINSDSIIEAFEVRVDGKNIERLLDGKATSLIID